MSTMQYRLPAVGLDRIIRETFICDPFKIKFSGLGLYLHNQMYLNQTTNK